MFQKTGFIASISLVLCVNLFADDMQDYTLDKVTTTGDKEFQFNNKDFINSKDLSERQANSMSDVFATQPDVNVGGGGMMAQKIYVRGIEDRLLRVTIDGAAQNGNAFHHQGNTVIDPGMLKEVEITKGAANASAGPGAIAGAISMTTKDASDLLEKGQKFGAYFKSSFYTNFGLRENASVYGRIGKHFDALVYYVHQNIFYYRNGEHTFKNLFHPTEEDKVLGSNSQQNNVLVKANAYINEKDKLAFTYNLTRDNATRPFRANVTNPSAASQEDGVNFAQELFHHVDSNNNIVLEYDHKGGENFGSPKVKLDAYGSIRNIHLTPLFNPMTAKALDGKSLSEADPEGSTPRNIFLNNSGVDLKITHPIATNYSNTLDYGLNFQNMTVMDKDQKEINEALGRGKEVSNIVGGYVQANYSFLKSLTIGAGTRYDVYVYDDKNWQRHTTQGFSPSVAILYNPVQTVDLKLSYAYVTRGALPGDALLLDSDVKIDKHLKSEKGQNVEFDADWTSEYFSLRGAVFYQVIADFINSYGVVHETANTSEEITDRGLRENMKDKINIYGYELGATFNYGNFLASVGFSRSYPTVRGRLISDTYELGATTGNNYILKLEYNFTSIGLDLQWLSRFVQDLSYDGYDIYNEDFSHVHKAGYGVHNIFINYTPTKIKGLTFSIALNNLFNKFYIDQTSPLKVEADGKASDSINQVRKALAQPGFDGRFEISYKF
ncbi:TonB-dependent receptor [Helicobacter sp. 11S03491-1]|uniref:TonB-dependent receptor domain-containing protein n=1 Tax=Helicobacter sp. 11S03491-1 TaxID=1476196 RepID=UPI000BA71FE2|nr:TonB-dependent receptor [Helicobacter sp. 11S03491-1]PAF43019.1 hypothetical protein BKH45_02820 [Helicobacter sp. 11S03491-1]